jgi:hypothetical protein
MTLIGATCLHWQNAEVAGTLSAAPTDCMGPRRRDRVLECCKSCIGYVRRADEWEFLQQCSMTGCIDSDTFNLGRNNRQRSERTEFKMHKGQPKQTRLAKQLSTIDQRIGSSLDGGLFDVDLTCITVTGSRDPRAHNSWHVDSRTDQGWRSTRIRGHDAAG